MGETRTKEWTRYSSYSGGLGVPTTPLTDSTSSSSQIVSRAMCRPRGLHKQRNKDNPLVQGGGVGPYTPLPIPFSSRTRTPPHPTPLRSGWRDTRAWRDCPTASSNGRTSRRRLRRDSPYSSSFLKKRRTTPVSLPVREVDMRR